MRATSSIPIVFGVVGDPVAEGFVTSLARPDSNATGLSYVTSDMVGKWLELLKQVAPGVSLVAVLLRPDFIPQRAKDVRLDKLAAAGQALGVQLQIVEAQGPADLRAVALRELPAAKCWVLVYRDIGRHLARPL